MGRSWDRIPVGARFNAPIENGPGAHPAAYAMCTGSFPGVKRPGRDVDHPPTSSAKVKERVELYLYSTSGPLWPVIGRTLPLPLPIPLPLPSLWDNNIQQIVKEKIFGFNDGVQLLFQTFWYFKQLRATGAQ